MRKKERVTKVKVLAFLSAILIVSLIFGVYATVYTSPTPNPGHTADNILVKTATGEPTLQQAIDSGSLCGNSASLIVSDEVFSDTTSKSLGLLDEYTICFLTKVYSSSATADCFVERNSTDWILRESGSIECGARCIR